MTQEPGRLFTQQHIMSHAACLCYVSAGLAPSVLQTAEHAWLLRPGLSFHYREDT